MDNRFTKYDAMFAWVMLKHNLSSDQAKYYKEVWREGY